MSILSLSPPVRLFYLSSTSSFCTFATPTYCWVAMVGSSSVASPGATVAWLRSWADRGGVGA
jgi:hypothetical protein